MNPNSYQIKLPKFPALPAVARALSGMVIVLMVIFSGGSLDAAPRLKTIATGLKKPVHVVFAPGRARAYYVVEQGGRIIRFAGGKRRVFLDIRRVVNKRWEEGLLSMAFPPGYVENGPVRASSFYIYYTTGRPSSTIVAEIPIRRGRAIFSRKRIVLRVRQPYANHNGGHILFGPDKMLYIGLGDGGSAGDPRGYAQNPLSLLGKILRIDPRPQGRRQYRVPRDNPFAGRPTYRPEIFALGLRNPWRMAFDRRTGRLYTGDVGQNEQEEVALVGRGSNQGWNPVEGNLCYRPKRNCGKHRYAAPIHVYSHDYGSSITGGYVYRGRRVRGYYGRYFFADYLSGRVWALPLRRDGKAAGPARQLFRRAGRVSSFGEDVSGELYMLLHGKGRLVKIVD